MQKVIFYLLVKFVLSYIVFFGFIDNSMSFQNLKMTKLEDYTYLLFMFGTPVIVDLLIFTPFFIFILKRPLILSIVLFAVSLFIEALIGYYFFSLDIRFIILKMVVGSILFFIFFSHLQGSKE